MLIGEEKNELNFSRKLKLTYASQFLKQLDEKGFINVGVHKLILTYEQV